MNNVSRVDGSGFAQSSILEASIVSISILMIKRFGEGAEPCATDTHPGDGFGCKGGPKSIQVCGLCGILSGSSYPTGGYVPGA